MARPTSCQVNIGWPYVIGVINAVVNKDKVFIFVKDIVFNSNRAYLLLRKKEILMSIKKVVNGVYAVGSKDPYRPLFDQLMPLPEGTSYNAFLIKGENKIALIDTVYAPFEQELELRLKENDITQIDYIIANHGEQDHSGALPNLLKRFPMVKIVTNQKCKDIMVGFLPLKDDSFMIVKDDDVLDLGRKSLRFMLMPWVHWPDTMFVYLPEDNILFTTDFFGAHATGFDLFWDDDVSLIPLIKSYYAEIMMPFASIFKKYLSKVELLHPRMIAPAHGPLYKNPSFVIDLYKKWSSDEKKKQVILMGVSMYGSTQKMIDYVVLKIQEKGIEVKVYDAVHFNTTDLTCDLIESSGLIIATPTVLTGVHPTVIMPLYLINILKPSLRFLSLIGSYSWGTTIDKQVVTLVSSLKSTQILAPVLAKGTPKENDFKAMDELVEQIAKLSS